MKNYVKISEINSARETIDMMGHYQKEHAKVSEVSSFLDEIFIAVHVE